MTNEELWNGIINLAAVNNMTCSGLARFANLDPTIFNKSKRTNKFGQLRWPSTYALAKILDATHTSLEDFAKLMKS